MRQILGIDVDGVLRPLGPVREEGVNVYTSWGSFFFPQSMKTRLAVLSQVYQLRWFTTWGDDANEYLCVPLELPRLKVFPLGQGDTPVQQKINGICAWARWHPWTHVTLVDDEVDFHQGRINTYCVDSLFGLSDEGVALLSHQGTQRDLHNRKS